MSRKPMVAKRKLTVESTDLLILRVREMTREHLEAARHLSVKLKGALCIVMGPKDRIEQFGLREQLALYGGLQRRLVKAGYLKGDPDKPELTEAGREAATANAVPEKEPEHNAADDLILPPGTRRP